MVVVETVNNFIDFMYTYYKLEYEAPADKLCIKTQTDILHLYMKTGTVPEDIYNLEYNVTIIFSQETTDKIISDLKDSMSVEISKAKFKLNAASTLFDTIESNDSPTESPQTKAKVCFNITTCSDIKTWANAMKRKSKKKFHCIESFKFEELM
jgi:hypothetical protein